MSLLPGGLFHARYRVVRCIKRGGMGAVFEVFDERTDTRRALKVMHPDVVEDGDLRGRFEREARVTGAIESDHVVRVTDAGVDDESDTPFLVMELLRGSDLGAVLRDAGKVAPGDVVRYLGQAALGLERAHAAGIVHRDLKPENLFLTRRDDGSPCVKVLDFGIAKIIARRTQAKDTRTMGTPAYMAPEQIRGEGTIGVAADVYALGHIAYALLVGEDYWSEEAASAGSMFAFFSRVVQGMPEAPSIRAERTRGVPLDAAFDAWLHRAAATRPEDRFPGAAAAVAALAGALGVEAPPGLAAEAQSARVDREPAATSTLTTEIGLRDPIASTRAEGAHDTMPMSVWSQTGTHVSAGAPRVEATLIAPSGSSDEASITAPTAAPRPLARRFVGLFGVAAAAVALAWGTFGMSARAPRGLASGAGAPVDAPSASPPIVSPSASPPPSASSSAPPPSAAASDPTPRPSASARPPDAAKRPGKPAPAKPAPTADPVGGSVL